MTFNGATAQEKTEKERQEEALRRVQERLLEMREMEPLNFAPRVMLVGGGVPINIGGNFYGAIGVSGAPPRKVLGDIDDECARAGIDAVREAIEFAE